MCACVCVCVCVCEREDDLDDLGLERVLTHPENICLQNVLEYSFMYELVYLMHHDFSTKITLFTILPTLGR